MRYISTLFILINLFLISESSAAVKRYSRACYYSASEIKVFESNALDMINNIRKKHGLCPLKNWTQLANCAREHSQNMASGKTSFGHNGFEERAKAMQKQANLSSFAENVAYSYNYADPVKVAVDGWMKSPGHRENILGDFEESGIGVAISSDGKFYATQLFAKRAKFGRQNSRSFKTRKNRA